MNGTLYIHFIQQYLIYRRQIVNFDIGNHGNELIRTDRWILRKIHS